MECTIRLRERHGDTFQKKEIEEASSQRRAPQCARRAWNYYFSFVWPCCIQDLSSLIRDRTHVPRSGSTREVLELLFLTFSLVATFDILKLFVFIWSDWTKLLRGRGKRVDRVGSWRLCQSAPTQGPGSKHSGSSSWFSTKCQVSASWASSCQRRGGMRAVHAYLDGVAARHSWVLRSSAQAG